LVTINWFTRAPKEILQKPPLVRLPPHAILLYARTTRPNGTTGLALRTLADEVCTRCCRTSLCRFLRNVFIAELASDVELVSPCFNRAIKQRASRDCLSEASNTPNIRSNSTNAQAFSNAMLRISVSAESKKSRPKLRGVVVVITVPLRYCCLPWVVRL